MARSGASMRCGMGYFMRRSGDDRSVIQLHPGDREEVVESGLSRADAEKLYERKLDGLRLASPPASLDLPEPERRPRIPRGPSARQLAWKF
jgi:hypothetical protein